MIRKMPFLSSPRSALTSLPPYKSSTRSQYHFTTGFCSKAIQYRRFLSSASSKASSSTTNFTFPSGGSQEETIWLQLRELLGYSGDDPGHWNFSPEWWGTQNNGFGRTEGVTVFSKKSQFNGLVEVTSHPASVNGFNSDSQQEWRVLRFNKITRQSVARVRIVNSAAETAAIEKRILVPTGEQQQRRWLEAAQTCEAQPDCLASEYLKSMAALIAGLIGLQGLFSNGDKQDVPLRVLCIGLGGGSLPHFIMHYFQNSVVDAVEIDPVVVEAATSAMGLPLQSNPRLRIHTQDAVEYVEHYYNTRIKTNDATTIQSNNYYDLVCIDAFDGCDCVPESLCTGHFVQLLGKILNPRHGIVLMNFHSTDVRDIARILYAGLMSVNETAEEQQGCCFTTATQMQKNLTLACVRGLHLDKNDPNQAKEKLRLAAAYVADKLGYRFPAGSRSGRGFVSYF